MIRAPRSASYSIRRPPTISPAIGSLADSWSKERKCERFEPRNYRCCGTRPAKAKKTLPSTTSNGTSTTSPEPLDLRVPHRFATVLPAEPAELRRRNRESLLVRASAAVHATIHEAVAEMPFRLGNVAVRISGRAPTEPEPDA